MGRIFTQETMDKTNFSKSELILVVANMVRHGVAKNVKEAIAKLDAGELDSTELLNAIEEAHKSRLPKSDSEQKVNVR